MSATTSIIIKEHQDKLLFRFPPQKKQILSAVKKIRGSRWRKDKHWEVPREAAAKLLEISALAAGNETLLRRIADEMRPVVEQRRQLRKQIEQAGHATASALFQARYPRYVARSRKKKGHVVARYPRHPRIDQILLENAGGMWNSATGSTTFLESDLPLVAAKLKEFGFAFETALLEDAREAYRQLAKRKEPVPPDMSEQAWVLRGARSAPIEFRGRNGYEPWEFQKADIAYALRCLEELGGAGLLLDMGTGKTAISCITYDFLRQEHEDLRMLVLGPLAPLGTWGRELQSWLGISTYWAERATGDKGRRALEAALAARESDQPVAAVVSGSPDARREALALDPQIVIANYDSARTEQMMEDLADWVGRGERALIVCDEMHRFKNPESLTAQTILELVELPQFQKEAGGGRLGLTGTMVPQGGWEAYSQTAFLDGGLSRCRFGPSYHRFLRRFFHVDWGTQKRRRKDPKGFLNNEIKQEFIRLLEPGTVRRTSEEAQDLPEKTYNLLGLQLDGSFESQLYRHLARLKAGELEEMEEEKDSSINEDLLFLRMKQVLSHPANLLESLRTARESQAEVAAKIQRSQETGEVLDESELVIRNEDLLALSDEWVEKLERFVEQKKRPRKMDLLLDRLPDIFDARSKVIIGCDYTATEQALLELLEPHGVVHFRAGMQAQERAEIEERFQKDPRVRVALGKSRVMSEGLNLTAAKHLFMYDPTCNGSTKDWLQFQKRHHRGGQTDACWVHHLIVEETAEVYQLVKVIHRAIEGSKMLQDAITSLPPSIQDFLQAGRYSSRPKTKRDALSLLSALGG